MGAPALKPAIHPWLLVGLLWVVALLNYLDRQVVYSLFPLLERDLHAGSVELGLTSTVFLWVYGFLSPFAGYLADRFGRLRIIVLSLVVWSAVTWATAYAATVPQLLATRALMGVSEAFYLPAALALIVEAHGERSRSLATGIHQSGLYTGMALGGGWGGWMGEHYGWRSIFAILGGAGMAYVLLLYAVMRPIRARQPTAAEPPNFGQALSRLLALPDFRIMAGVFMIFGLASWIVYTWLPLYLYERFGMSLTRAGFSATFYIQAASYGGILAGGFMADRYSRASARSRILTQSLGLAVGAPFLFVIGVTTSHALLIAALITYGLGRGLYDANTMPALSQIAAPELRATGYGLFNLASCLVGGAGAAAAGSLKPLVGLSAAFEVCGALLLTGAFLLLRINFRPLSGH
jgi:MFS family permease